ncbi:MAG: hypothetical protein CMP07_09375 [Xanthomonadales bacterium]|nr:hypothetical protein [Xanthomonadales bacterium]
MLMGSARRALLWAGGATILSDIAQFAAMLVMVRLVSPAEYGQAALALGLYGLIAVFSFATFVQHVLQFRDPERVDWSVQLSGALIINVLLFVLSCGVAWVLYSTEKFAAAAVPLLLLSTTFILEIPGTLHLKYLQAHHEWGRFRSLHLGGTFLGLEVGVVVAAFGGGVWAVIISTPLLIVPASVDYLIHRRHGLTSIREWRRYRETFRFGMNRLGAALMLRGRVAFERGAVSSLYNFDALGVFNRSNGLANLIAGRFGQLAMQAMYPIVTRAEVGSSRFRRAADLVFRGACWITIPAGVFLALAADPVVRVIYGQGWLLVVEILPAAAAVAVATSISQVLALLLLANNNTRLSLLVDVVHGATAIALIVLVLPNGIVPFLWGLAATGAAASAVSYGLLWWRSGIQARSIMVSVPPPLVSAMVAGWAAHWMLLFMDMTNSSAIAKMTLFALCFALVVPAMHRILFPNALSDLLEVMPAAQQLRRILLYRTDA